MKSKWQTIKFILMIWGVILSSPTSSMAQNLDDAAIIAIYNQVNSFDIETALLGQIKGKSEDVRALAAMVARDHTGVRKAAHMLAGEIGVVPDLPPARADSAKAHYDAIEAMHKAQGKDFDRTYLTHEIAFHEAAIKAVKSILMPSASSEKLKAHFKAVLPHFEHHLAENRRIAKKLGYIE